MILKKKAKTIIDEIKDKIKLESITEAERVINMIDEFSANNADNQEECWEMAKEIGSDLKYIDSGLWKGVEDLDSMIRIIAYAGIRQEVYEIIFKDYSNVEEFIKGVVKNESKN